MPSLLKHSLWRTAGIAAVAELLLTACASSASSSKASDSHVVTFAEQPGGEPNYIFPLQSHLYFNYQDIGQFSNLMYLPLHKFGDHAQPVLDKGLSVAHPPVFSDGRSDSARAWIGGSGDSWAGRVLHGLPLSASAA
jgi:hypothetical protein